MDNDQIARLEKLALTVRMLAVDAVEQANSGHPGMPMGAADYATVLWAKYLNFDAEDPEWLGRDKFVLSAGHGSMLLYALLHLFGYRVSLDEIKNFRQWGSITPGHPEFGVTPGVETTTGPLGQGFANGVGLALSNKMLAARFSQELFGADVYGIVSDGDLMEGVASEAASLAGHLGLDNLIYIYDDNEISIDGNTDITFTEDVAARFISYNWFVQEVNAHDMQAIAACIEKAKAEKQRPSLIVAHSTIGLGSPNKSGTSDVHGAPLGADERKATKEHLGWPLEPTFYVPQEVGELCCKLAGEKKAVADKWRAAYSKWREANPDLAEQLDVQLERKVSPELLRDLLKIYKPEAKEATRSLSGKAVQVIAKHLPFFIGGSADLESSNKNGIKDGGEVQRASYTGRNIRFGVREHAMGAIVNGLAYTRSWVPHSATFLVFADYMRPAIRLAALSHLQSFFIFTHDSFWVGEDGPTHQPIEQLASLRIIPNLYVFRPADGMEVAACYWQALNLKNSPSAFLFTRQNLPSLQYDSGFDPSLVGNGGYVLSGKEHKELALVASGSEVHLAQQAADRLCAEGHPARVVSMPCMELFLELDQKQRQEILPESARKVSIEAGVTACWDKVVGHDALKIGLEHFGASAPGGLVAEKFGFTTEAIVKQIRAWL
ncbi:MAG: transketolase [Bdellovibrionales bacterium]|nr:transketolase [Bdellovibrionales bacterium]